jgi:hypothetical protein
MLDRRATIALSILTGIALELAIHAMTGRREAWDSSQYWSVGLPIAGVVALLLGYLAGGRRWIWTLLIVPAQVTTMMLRNGEIGTLWPLMMILACVLSLPFAGVAWVGAWLRSRRGGLQS